MVENVVPGVVFDTPTGIAFLPDGRMLVCEKRGRIWAVKNGIKSNTVVWQHEREVLNEHDRGLLDVAVDPKYFVNHYIYLLYTVDPDSDGVDTNGDGFGRIARYRINFTDSSKVDTTTRTILMGVDWSHAPTSGSPSHTIGSLRFGADGSLLVSCGDGAQYSAVDPGGLDAAMFGAGKVDPAEDIGAFRAQYILSLAGKILRINPANGHGYMSNPYRDSNLMSVRSRVWGYGVRNPFRFTVRPGTGVTDTSAGSPGTLYIGDVGMNTWEEMNVLAAPGTNFGWPCFEGFGQNSGYQTASPAHNGCGSFGTSTNPAQPSAPLASWHHNDTTLSVPAGFKGNASVGGVFYTGNRYPLPYRNQYFFADYGQSWIKVATVNASNQLAGIQGFATAADGPVDLQLDPVTRDIVYVAIVTGEVRRIRYTGVVADLPPVAVANGAPTAGAAPLSVDFSSAGSSDPDGDPLAFNWNFGDLTGSTAANPTHAYASAGPYQSVLTVDDGRGGLARDTVTIAVTASSGFPTTPVRDRFARANGPIGNGWTGDVSGLVVLDSVLAQTSSDSWGLWPTAYGATQEAYVTVRQIGASAGEHDLMLKVQGAGWSDGEIEVHWDPTLSHVWVNTYTPPPGLGWQNWAGPFTVPFVAGDRFGARAFANGAVQIYRNGVPIGNASVANWPFAASGGRIGLTIVGGAQSKFDDFGGGDASLGANTPPTVTILAPPDSGFYVAGDIIALHASATDAQDPPGTTPIHWEVIVHHNNHVHPSSFVADGDTASFVAENHDDGTGVFYEIDARAVDGGGLADTARVYRFPSIDLQPSSVTTIPSTPGTTAPATYRFALRDLGAMPAPISRWRLVSGTTTLAEGDTLVPAHDSVTVTRTLPPTLAAGPHVLRVVADTLHAVPETDETNNARTRTLTVVAGPGPDEVGPAFTLAPVAETWGVLAYVRWATNEPARGSVRFGPTRAFADSAMVPVDSAETARLEDLTLGGKYYFQVTATDTIGNTTVAGVDSFVTQTGPLAVPGTPSRFALSRPRPNPSRGEVTFDLALPAASRVAFAVEDIQGRTIWSAPAARFESGAWRLAWPGRDRTGAAVRPGVYLARVSVDGRTYVRRMAMVR